MSIRSCTAVALAVAILASVSAVSSASHAVDTMDSWAEYAQTGWYTEDGTEFEIGTAEELAGLALIVNNDEDEMTGKTIRLVGDIDLSDHEWVPIKTFQGIFDGNGHVIRNMIQVQQTVGGLFNTLIGGKISDLGLEDVHIENDGTNVSLGSLVNFTQSRGTTDPCIERCYATGSITVTDATDTIGGLIGRCTGGTIVSECFSSVSITVDNEAEATWPDYVGGVIGYWEDATSSALIEDCYFDGSIFVDGPAGSIVSDIISVTFYTDVTIRGCFVTTEDIEVSENGTIIWITVTAEYNVTS